MDAVSWPRPKPGGPLSIAGNVNPCAEPFTVNFDSGSFRDRSSRVFLSDNQVYRTLTAESKSIWQRVSAAPFYARMTATGQIVETRELSPDECQRFQLPSEVAGILHHERIPFVSYPYEWSFAMLRQAALLHLQIMSEAIKYGFTMKDASPYNVLFHGSKPIFIDIGSFQDQMPGEPWAAYRQFCELMLFPLLLQAYRDVHFQPLLRGQLEGIPARQFLQWMRVRDLFRPGVFTNGWLQAMLERKTQTLSTSTVQDLRSSGFRSSMVEQLLTKLTRTVSRLEWLSETTQWTRYNESLPHVGEDVQVKSDFVRKICQWKTRQLVWDLGCNDGRYSKIASEWALTVVAMDQDHSCIERLYRSLDPGQTRILPLYIDLANPSPALGWRGLERKRLENRGRPQLVICLGLIHHLVIAANIPVREVIDWLASLGGELILEFPSKRDDMVRALLRNKRDQYDDYSLENVEHELLKHFEIRLRESLPSGERTLIHAVPNSTTETAS